MRFIVHVYRPMHNVLQLPTNQHKSSLPRLIFTLPTYRFEWHRIIAIGELSGIQHLQRFLTSEHPSNFREGISWTRDGPLLSTPGLVAPRLFSGTFELLHFLLLSYITGSQHCANDSPIFGRIVEFWSLLGTSRQRHYIF